MKLPNDYDESPRVSTTVIKTIIVVSFFIIAILILVLVLNQNDNQKKSGSPLITSQVTEDSLQNEQALNEEPITSGYLSPEDFDFWDLYPEDTPETVVIEKQEKKEEKNDPATDGKHTLVKNSKGEEEWVLISPYLPKNDYDYTRLVCQSDIMKYFVDGKQVSYVGVDLSKYQDYVDFVKLKKAGIDYVMLRVGSRGYGTGQLTLDDYYLDNIKRATDAGLDIGLYFYSQAITLDEAVEEANFVLSNIGDYKITYPIAFDMELINNDTSRIENLTREEKTNITKKFLETIKNAGYMPMIYGNKEWLIKKIDLSKLTDYDVWLSQPGDIPDYPYKFTMWQYSTTTGIDGIAGYANMNISFIDYSEK